MHFFQIFLVTFGIFIYLTQSAVVLSQILYPQNHKPLDSEGHNKNTKTREESKNDQIFIAKLPAVSKNNEPNIKSNITSLNKTSSNQISLNVNGTSGQTVNKSYNNLPKINETLEEKNVELTSGAITRGILVFVAISFLFILYVGLKTCRRKSGDKKHTMVRKYGIRARRTDVEMEPLPLSDDDEDETVFDLTASKGSTGQVIR